MDIETVPESEKKVRFVLEKFMECEESFEKSGNMLYRNIANRLIKLLPFCTKDEYESSNYLFNYFEIADWQSKNIKKKEALLIFMQSLS